MASLCMAQRHDAPAAASTPASGTAKSGSAHDEKLVTVVVTLLEADSDKGKPAQASVRIEGGQNTFDTNAKGIVKIPLVPAGKAILIVGVPGAPVCRLPLPAAAAAEVSVVITPTDRLACHFEH